MIIMAIFKQKKEDLKNKTEKSSSGVKKTGDTVELIKKELKRFKTDEVLRAPRITEKAALQNQYNVYVFEVLPSATKRDIDFAVRSIYNVRPKKIRTAIIPRQAVNRRKGGRGFTSKGKKAYVYLHKDDSISLI